MRTRLASPSLELWEAPAAIPASRQSSTLPGRGPVLSPYPSGSFKHPTGPMNNALKSHL